MAEYITKEQAKLAIKKRLGTMDLFESRFNADIDAIPAADVVEVVHGEWVTDDKGVTYCGNCRHIDDYASVHNYCPNCGAKMDGERKDT